MLSDELTLKQSVAGTAATHATGEQKPVRKSFDQDSAPGGPGIEPRWTRGTKIAIGTAYSTSSRVWYTLDPGCVTEVYYPTIDTPQIRDLQFLFTDGETFFHDARRSKPLQGLFRSAFFFRRLKPGMAYHRQSSQCLCP